MHVLAVASQKGGSGKSTVAIHLAALAQQQGIETLLADMDPHSQTTAEWGAERIQEAPVVVQVNHEDLSALLSQAETEGFGLVILDLPPYVNTVVEEATRQADLTLVPCRPSFSDLRTLPRVIERIHPPFTIVLNACPPGHSPYEATKTCEARCLLNENNIPVCPVSITQRVAFQDSLNGGEAVVEYAPGSKASLEVAQLFKHVYTEIHS